MLTVHPVYILKLREQKSDGWYLSWMWFQTSFPYAKQYLSIEERLWPERCTQPRPWSLVIIT